MKLLRSAIARSKNDIPFAHASNRNAMTGMEENFLTTFFLSLALMLNYSFIPFIVANVEGDIWLRYLKSQYFSIVSMTTGTVAMKSEIAE
jgi:hypothetical protein